MRSPGQAFMTAAMLVGTYESCSWTPQEPSGRALGRKIAEVSLHPSGVMAYWCASRQGHRRTDVWLLAKHDYEPL
jgi:hypothetical protein